ncbi:Hypothetical predicted protein [Podarcis lilfordi]|uniref:Carboxypeptidase inhibitor n=1 Tax=Podarcis lilfordi TaxID=74358 RepID=A0AA35K6U8_9SAUR|nr:Hypothetical predicted protein [Podarcis lilfordi]
MFSAGSNGKACKQLGGRCIPFGYEHYCNTNEYIKPSDCVHSYVCCVKGKICKRRGGNCISEKEKCPSNEYISKTDCDSGQVCCKK